MNKKIMLPLGLFILTFSILSLEVVFTRLYSFVFDHNYVYLVISLGISGMGLGSYLYYLGRNKIEKYFSIILFLPLLFSALLFLLMYLFPGFILIIIINLLLFTVLGIFSSYAYKQSVLKKSLIYFIDLTGAATGAIMTYFIIQQWGVPKTVQLIFLVQFLSLWLLSFSRKNISKKIKYSALAILFAVSFTIFIPVDSLINLPPKSKKELNHYIKNNSKVVDSSWKAFGKTDLITTEDPDAMIIFVDGSAGTSMVRDTNISNQGKRLEQIIKRTPALVFFLLSLDISPASKSLILGSGGGIEVSSLLDFGMTDITAVEINPGFIDIVQKNGEFNGNIYNNHPFVKLFKTDGRQFVRKRQNEFDFISISIPLIKSLRNYQSYALAENYLFTYNAFNDYLSALKDTGYLVIRAHNELEMVRLVMNALKAFENIGINNVQAMKRLAMIDVGHHSPILIIKKSPFSEVEANRLHSGLHSLPDQKEGINFIPHIGQQTVIMTNQNNYEMTHRMFNQHFYNLSTGRVAADDLVKYANINIKPVSDNRPFFYYFESGTPVTVIVIVVIALLLLMFIYFKDKNQRAISLKFVLIGMAFMMIEIVVLQRLTVFWGQDTLAISLVLATVLISAGLGSLSSSVFANKKRSIPIITILIVLLSALFMLISSKYLNKVEFDVTGIKLAVTVLLTFPLFFIMGMIFPRLLEKTHVDNIPKMIALNSIASLLGTVLALVFALNFGFYQVMILGSVLYLFLIIPDPGVKS